VYLYTSGNSSGAPHCRPPEGRYTVFFETVLRPGQQFTILPNTQHWFQSGDEGAVVSEFSTHSDDESDIFTDPRIVRVPVICE
jgi:D-lyxose ketol-isomerase